MNAERYYLFRDFENAVKNLKTGVASASSHLEIDGAIKRFELCYELAWKLMKDHLASVGFVCRSPRDCFKAAKEMGIIENETSWLKMIEDRNRLVHSYTFEQSRIIYDDIKSIHAISLLTFYKKIRKEYSKK